MVLHNVQKCKNVVKYAHVKMGKCMNNNEINAPHLERMHSKNAEMIENITDLFFASCKKTDGQVAKNIKRVFEESLPVMNESLKGWFGSNKSKDIEAVFSQMEEEITKVVFAGIDVDRSNCEAAMNELIAICSIDDLLDSHRNKARYEAERKKTRALEKQINRMENEHRREIKKERALTSDANHEKNVYKTIASTIQAEKRAKAKNAIKNRNEREKREFERFNNLSEEERLAELEQARQTISHDFDLLIPKYRRAEELKKEATLKNEEGRLKNKKAKEAEMEIDAEKRDLRIIARYPNTDAALEAKRRQEKREEQRKLNLEDRTE